MNIETIREYILHKPSVTEGFPFGEDTLVFKVKEKIFFLAGLDSSPLQFNVKCDPEKAIELRAEYPSVQPGFHMSKSHWNTVIVDGSVRDEVLLSWVEDSYELVGKVKNHNSKIKKSK
jgi:predicted DNA-binding protein (MmcQ/YjbR family)